MDIHIKRTHQGVPTRGQTAIRRRAYALTVPRTLQGSGPRIEVDRVTEDLQRSNECNQDSLVADYEELRV